MSTKGFVKDLILMGEQHLSGDELRKFYEDMIETMAVNDITMDKEITELNEIFDDALVSSGYYMPSDETVEDDWMEYGDGC